MTDQSELVEVFLKTIKTNADRNFYQPSIMRKTKFCNNNQPPEIIRNNTVCT